MLGSRVVCISPIFRPPATLSQHCLAVPSMKGSFYAALPRKNLQRPQALQASTALLDLSIRAVQMPSRVIWLTLDGIHLLDLLGKICKPGLQELQELRLLTRIPLFMTLTDTSCMYGLQAIQEGVPGLCKMPKGSTLSSFNERCVHAWATDIAGAVGEGSLPAIWQRQGHAWAAGIAGGGRGLCKMPQVLSAFSVQGENSACMGH